MSATSRLAEHVGFDGQVVFETIGDAVVPWRFGSFETDYDNIRQGVAAIDLSGAGLVGVRGSGAEDLLQASFTRDISYMTPERTVSGLILREDGRPLDAVTVFRTDDQFIVQTSIGRGTEVRAALAERAEQVSAEVDVSDASEQFVLIGVEGPRTVEAVAPLLTEPIDGLPFQAVRRTPWRDGEVVVSRSGSTSEFGYTFLASWEQAAEVWNAVASVAEPTGWEAMEAAMIEVRQPVMHRELFDDDTVISAGLNWLVDIEKEDFVGRDAVVAEVDLDTSSQRVSIVSDVALARGMQLASDGDVLGDVAHAVYSPSLGAHCGIARVRNGACASGLELAVVDAAGGPLGTARSVSSPAVVPTSWKSLRS